MNDKFKKIIRKKNKSKIVCLTAYSKNIASFKRTLIPSGISSTVTRSDKPYFFRLSFFGKSP